ncbi:MAG: hypothetical protein ACXITV_07060 [Luteibaculaceae bacterium]
MNLTTRKLSFKSKTLKGNLILILFWVFLFAVTFYLDSTRVFSNGLLGALLVLVLDFVVKFWYGYIRLTNQHIVIYNFLIFKQRVSIKQLISFQENDGDLTLKTASKTYTINGKFLSDHDYAFLLNSIKDYVANGREILND